MTFKKTHHLIIVIFFVVYALTFLPNFNILNTLDWVGPFPLPMAWVLLLNVINTLVIWVIYRNYFVPFARRMEKAKAGGAD
ncbi:hypothetical protein ACE1TF_15755 [Geomicrobium sp. JSM 1781026]|uniref:hypothetical protein n=1 Tax=Geomicrobium sp. JSM 1781026 TaxID=3344580 RepID=UPI0035C1C5E3